MAYEYYSLLGVDKNATADEIKKAYRKKAMDLHPDRHGGDKTKEAEFKKVNEAYDTLSTPEKKARYDQFGWNAEAAQGGFGGGGGFGWFQGGNFDFSDIFESFFQGGQGGFGGGAGGARKKSGVIDGEDIEIRIRIDFPEAVSGTSKKISYPKKKSCSACNGSGAKAGTKPKACSACGWSGAVRKRVQTFFGVVEQAVACSTCHGEWTIIESKCQQCSWNKRTQETAEKVVEIPPGIDDGMTIKIRGEGHEGAGGGRAGDLFITFSVPHSFEGLERDWYDLKYVLRIDPVEAILGLKKSIKIPVVGERVLEIHPGTQHGEIFRYRGDGIRHVSKDARWDLFVTVEIRIPEKLGKRERELYEEIAKEKDIASADGKGFFGKIFD